jgi:hypothetical protein
LIKARQGFFVPSKGLMEGKAYTKVAEETDSATCEENG